MNTAEPVLVEVDERVAVITLNRPEARNALNRECARRSPAAIERCDADDDVDVMILTGADPAFCAGVDLKEFGSGEVRQGRGIRRGGGAPRRPHTRSAVRCLRTRSR